LTGSRGPILAATLVSAVAVVLVALTLRPPEVPSYALTAGAPNDAGRALVGPVLYTLDATSAETWRTFSFKLGAVVDGSGDHAFKRYAIVAGPGAGILDLGETAFEQVRTVPADGYVVNEGAAEPRNPAIASWYTYGFFTHVLSP